MLFTWMLSPTMQHLRNLDGSTPSARVAALLLAVLLAACSATPSPPRPAMVPLGSANDYGYSEVRLQDDRYQVSYISPRQRVSASRSDREAEVARERTRAHDFALWRAAQLAQEKGFVALEVLEEHTDSDVDVTVGRGYRPDPFFYGYYGYRDPWYWRRPWYPYRPGYFGDPFYDPFYGPGYYYERPHASLRVSARLVVRFFKTTGDDARAAADISAEMTKTYGAPVYR
jgi:hypothetical protein